MYNASTMCQRTYFGKIMYKMNKRNYFYKNGTKNKVIFINNRAFTPRIQYKHEKNN